MVGPDIEHPGCRLVAWKNICRSKEQGGWGILDLNSFNLALLGKWMLKLGSGSNWGGVQVLKFNYINPIGVLSRRPRGRVSYFWSGESNCLSAFRACVTVEIHSGADSFFWKDRWLNGLAPMNIWPDEFLETARPNGTVRELVSLLSRSPFAEAP